MDELTEREQHDLAFHEQCRQEAAKFGAALYGSTRGRGYSMFYKGKVVEMDNGSGVKMLVEDQHAELTTLRQQLAAGRERERVLRGGLEPFTRFAEFSVEPDPVLDRGGIWSDTNYHRDRIVDWFGPSDFWNARQALAAALEPEETTND